MTKKNGMLLVVVAVLATVYAVWFTNWFKPATVQIFHANRGVARVLANGAMPSLIFGLNSQLKLNEIKVVPLAGFQTNRNILPLWHLVSDSNSVPLKNFTYGQAIRGLRPAIKGIRAQPLETNIVYRLIVTAGKVKGEHDFKLGGE